MAAAGSPLPIEDPLEYLPRGAVVEIARGQHLYTEHQPAGALYVLTRGRVAISLPASDGRMVAVDVCSPERFLGLPALIYADRYGERATALDSCVAMWWSSDMIERYVEKQPRLGMALMQMVIEHTSRFSERLISMSGGSTVERLSCLLLMLGAESGEAAANGALRLPGLTHQTLAECVGASREVVTTSLNLMRRQGYLTYSRKFFELSESALRDLMRQNRPVV
jgi:CRP/FNR family transcriptional regulator